MSYEDILGNQNSKQEIWMIYNILIFNAIYHTAKNLIKL